jgi:hypothetical protein
MARHWKVVLAVLAVLLVIGLFSLPALLRNVSRLRQAGATEDQARREIAQAQVSTPQDVREKAQLFWASQTSPGTLEPTEVELPLSAEPVQRSKQVLTALIAQAPTDAQRTLPVDVEVLDFYLLADGMAVADFSETLGTETPSGIFSEQMAVDSILQTLGANVPAVHSLKILIHGQEADTLAGHLDLTGFFVVPAPPAAASDAGTPPPAAAAAATIAQPASTPLPAPVTTPAVSSPALPATAPAARQ